MTLLDIKFMVESITGRTAHGVGFIREGLVRVYMEGGINRDERRRIEHRRPLTIEVEVVDCPPAF